MKKIIFFSVLLFAVACKKKTLPQKEKDLIIIDEAESKRIKAAAVRLTFDGYNLRWIETGKTATFTAFSGKADESAKESVADFGPTPQGLYAVDPKFIEDLVEGPAWGSYRVPLQPYAATVDRMRTCFSIIRVGMYIHGGSETGTHGCLELNDDAEEKDFFTRLKALSGKIELEVRYKEPRKTNYQDTGCPY